MPKNLATTSSMQAMKNPGYGLGFIHVCTCLFNGSLLQDSSKNSFGPKLSDVL